MYTNQALWTQAREQLNVTTIICNNRCYRILHNNLGFYGITEPGPITRSLLSLAEPEINFSRIASAYGIPSVRVETADDLVVQLQRTLSAQGPNMIELML
jgi:acetolactate synthase I/II/III large subunit